MTKPPYSPVIRSQADLEKVWHDLMGSWGFGGRTVWMMTIAGERPIPQLMEITECDDPPEEAETGLAELLETLDAAEGPGLRFAFLYSRPGRRAVTEEDRAWARHLMSSCRTAGVRHEVVHVATAHGVFPITPDDLLASA